MSRPSIVFICTHNACLGPMAEGLAREIYGNAVSVCSGGTHPLTAVDQSAILVMKERGIDISHHVPKHVNNVDVGSMDLVVTLCAVEGNYFDKIAGKQIQRELKDPLESLAGPQEKMKEFRRVRDELELLVLTLYPDLVVGEEKHLDQGKSFALEPSKSAALDNNLSVWVLLIPFVMAASLIGYLLW